MKKKTTNKAYSKTAWWLTLSMLLLTSCQFETSDNGRLDGFWKLTAIDTLSTGGTKDLTEASLFWSIQANILVMQDTEQTDHYLFRFLQSADTLIVSQPFIYDRYQGDIPMSDPAPLHPFGIHRLTENFIVQFNTHSHLTLAGSDFRLHLKKF